MVMAETLLGAGARESLRPVLLPCGEISMEFTRQARILGGRSPQMASWPSQEVLASLGELTPSIAQAQCSWGPQGEGTPSARRAFILRSSEIKHTPLSIYSLCGIKSSMTSGSAFTEGAPGPGMSSGFVFL